MSKVDDYERMTGECKRLTEDVKVLCRLKKDQIPFTEETVKELKGYNTADLLIEGIQSPEFRKILTSILEQRVQKAKDDAVEECQKFLEKHIVREVMES